MDDTFLISYQEKGYVCVTTPNLEPGMQWCDQHTSKCNTNYRWLSLSIELIKN